MFRALALIVVVGVTLEAHAASFNCRKATTKAEKLVCSSAKLSELDERLHRGYVSALARACDANSLREEQRRWVRLRDTLDHEDRVMQLYEDRVAWLARRNVLTLARRVTVSPALGEYSVVLNTRGCLEYRAHHRQTYRLSISNTNGAHIQDIDMQSTEKPENVFRFVDMDGDGYEDLEVVNGYGAGPFPMTTLYRYSKDSGGFKEDREFPGGLATPAEQPGCVYLQARQHAGPEIGYDYVMSKVCLAGDTNRWQEDEGCSLASDKECYERIDRYIREWHPKNVQSR